MERSEFWRERQKKGLKKAQRTQCEIRMGGWPKRMFDVERDGSFRDWIPQQIQYRRGPELGCCEISTHTRGKNKQGVLRKRVMGYAKKRGSTINRKSVRQKESFCANPFR